MKTEMKKMKRLLFVNTRTRTYNTKTETNDEMTGSVGSAGIHTNGRKNPAQPSVRPAITVEDETFCNRLQKRSHLQRMKSMMKEISHYSN